ncbi:MAG: hydantoinase B/oxoprolinase family protein [Rhodospirillaceae bacterium]|jgi:N-methylhydantoinase B|nr:hydantoinase B/oxoprolinase family protein [Rhodospirillaceae bacterium]MBT5456599.1 hydantoinase B/oxoprolinase family protein [Rhodospirillaceae bacterium]
MDSSGKRVDPITLEVIRGAFTTLADEIDTNLARTAYSMLIYEYKDYAVGILDAEGRLICQCTGGMPIFIADVLGAAVRDGLEIYGKDNLHPGDVIITNHAATMGQHLNNVAMYSPVFAGRDGEELVAFVVITAHWLDIGGRVVSSISKYATDIFQEGIQFRTVKLFSRGERVAEIYRMIENNTRFPDLVRGDVEAQRAGCLMGCERLGALFDRYGADTLAAAVETIWDQSEAAARDAVRAIPDGRYEADSFLDDDGIDLDVPLPIRIAVEVAGDDMTIDFSNIVDQVRGPLNSGVSGGGYTVARVAFKFLVAPHEPANEGTFRALKLNLPPGKILSATDNAAMGRYNMPLPTVIDTVIKAMAPAMPDHAAAAHFGNFCTLRFHGKLPGTGALFQMNDSGYGGWGALAGMDGPGPFRTNCHGDTRVIPAEVLEATYPVRVDAFELRTDSGGPGEFRGGLGLTKKYTMLAPLTVSTGFERSLCPPWGVLGGGDGDASRVIIEQPGEKGEMVLKDERPVAAGGRVIVETGGGGGYGPPAKRSEDSIADDIRYGYVSKEAAKMDYGHAEK